jgi:hypothetical protein
MKSPARGRTPWRISGADDFRGAPPYGSRASTRVATKKMTRKPENMWGKEECLI